MLHICIHVDCEAQMTETRRNLPMELDLEHQTPFCVYVSLPIVANPGKRYIHVHEQTRA